MLPFPILNQYGNIVLPPETITALQSNNDSTFILYSGGNLYARGRNNNSKLGLGTTGNITTWTHTLSGVKLFGNSSSSTIAVKYDNTVWHCGTRYTSGSNFSSSNTVWTDITSKFSSVLDISTISTIKMGLNCTFVLLTNGNLYAMGYPSTYEMGRNSRTFVESLILLDTAVQSVFPINVSTFYIKNGILWRCGDNSNYQLGTGNTTNLTTFTSWNTSTVQDVYAGDSFSSLVSNENNILKYYTTGRNTGYSGISQSSFSYTTDINLNNKFSMFKQFGYSSSFPCIIFPSIQGGLYTCGENRAGQLGNSTSISKTTFTSDVIGYTSLNYNNVKFISTQCYNNTDALTFLYINNSLFYSGSSIISNFAATTTFLPVTDLPQ